MMTRTLSFKTLKHARAISIFRTFSFFFFIKSKLLFLALSYLGDQFMSQFINQNINILIIIIVVIVVNNADSMMQKQKSVLHSQSARSVRRMD